MTVAEKVVTGGQAAKPGLSGLNHTVGGMQGVGGDLGGAAD